MGMIDRQVHSTGYLWQIIAGACCLHSCSGAVVVTLLGRWWHREPNLTQWLFCEHTTVMRSCSTGEMVSGASSGCAINSSRGMCQVYGNGSRTGSAISNKRQRKACYNTRGLTIVLRVRAIVTIICPSTSRFCVLRCVSFQSPGTG